MRCPICLQHIEDIGDGYQCRRCGYFLEYHEVEECEDEIFVDECYIEYEQEFDINEDNEEK